MVADEAADLGLTGRDRIALQRDMDLAVVVAQVAVGGDRPEVHPLADVGVTEEPFVILVGMALDDRRLDLAADPAVRADDTPPRRLARKSWVSRPMQHGPSIRVNGWTQTSGPTMIGPFVVSKTVYGSIRAVS